MKIKRGHIREDGQRYWSKTSWGGEWWVSPEKYEELKQKNLASNERWIKANPERLEELKDGYAARDAAKREAQAWHILLNYLPFVIKRIESEDELRRKKSIASGKRWLAKNPGYMVERYKRVTTAAHRKKRSDRAMEKYYANLESSRAKAREGMRKLRESSPEALIKFRLRSRIKVAVRSELLGRIGSRSDDRVSARFLVWLAARTNLNITECHLDHVYPLSKFDDAGLDYLPNAPENVQWLTADENRRKHETIPSQAQLDAHLELVKEWRALEA